MVLITDSQRRKAQAATFRPAFVSQGTIRVRVRCGGHRVARALDLALGHRPWRLDGFRAEG